MRKIIIRSRDIILRFCPFIEMKDWMRHCVHKEESGFSFQRRHVGKGVCPCNLQDGRKDMAKLLGHGILYQVQ